MNLLRGRKRESSEKKNEALHLVSIVDSGLITDADNWQRTRKEHLCSGHWSLCG